MNDYAMSSTDSTPLRRSSSPHLNTRAFSALAQALVLVGLFIGIKMLGIGQFSGQIGLLVCTIAATLMMRRDGQSWADLGLRWAKNRRDLAKGAGMVIAVLVAAIGINILAQMLLPLFLGGPVVLGAPDVSTLPLYILIMGTVWTTNAFGEEMVMRGFLMSRLNTVFGRTRYAWVLAAFVQAIIFGFAHAYQGPAGIIITGMVGLAFGLLYLVAKRNLWPLIIAHGINNSIGMTMLHLQQTGALAAA